MELTRQAGKGRRQVEVRRNQIILMFIKQDQEPGFYLKAVGSRQIISSRGVTISEGLWRAL